MKKYIIVFFLLFLLTNLIAAEKTCISGNCINGAGTVVYSDGNLYIGEFKYGKKHGKGVLLYNDGTKFEGQWRNDQILYVTTDDKPLKNKKKTVKVRKKDRVLVRKTKKKKAYKRVKVSKKPVSYHHEVFSQKLKKSFEETMLKYHENLKKEYIYEMNEMDWKYSFSKIIFIVMTIVFLIGLSLSGYFFYISIQSYKESMSVEMKTTKKSAILQPWQKDMLLFFYAVTLFIGTLTLFYLYLANVFVY